MGSSRLRFSSARSRPPMCQAGFTVVEILVVMVVFGIIMSVVTRTLIDKLDGQTKSVATQRVVAKANEVADQLGDDLRSSRSPDRDPEKVGDVDRLREAVLDGKTITDANNVSVTLDVRDVLVAEPTRLQFRADVVASPPGRVECVTYVVGADGSFWRTVSEYSTTAKDCSGPVLLSTEIMPATN